MVCSKTLANKTPTEQKKSQISRNSVYLSEKFLQDCLDRGCLQKEKGKAIKVLHARSPIALSSIVKKE